MTFPLIADFARAIDRPRGRWLRAVVARMVAGFFRVALRLRVRGANQVPRHGGCLLVAPHASYTDAVVVAAACRRPVRFLGAANLCRHRWLRLVFWLFDVIPVDKDRARQPLRAVIDALRAGEVVCIFPEGQITPHGQIGDFQRGFSVAAHRARVPVVPVLLQYSLLARRRPLGLWMRGLSAKLLTPISAAVEFLDPMDPEQATSEVVRAAIVERGAETFAQNPELERHLAVRALEGLKRAGSRVSFVDYSAGRREVNGLKLLAMCLALAGRWRGRFAEPRVGVVLPTGLGSVVANLALTFLGKIPVNLNFTAGPAATSKALAKAGVRTVITAGAMREKVPGFPWEGLTVVDLADERKALSKGRLLRTYLGVRFLSARAITRWYDLPQAGGEREAGLLFSSGSTGEPKGVVLTHQNILANCLQIEACQLLNAEQKLLACLPTFHSFGFTVTLWYPLLNGLPTVFVPSPLETRAIADAIEKEQATVLLAAPTFLRPFLKRIAPAQLRSLAYVVAGAEKTPVGFADQWEQAFGSRYLEGYGLTETSPVVSVNLPAYRDLPEQIRAGSVGRLFVGMAARITGASTGEVLPLGQRGILELKGANVFAGYLDDRAATEAMFRDGWLVTGDLARLDEDGYLFVEGRLSRFSKIGGEMVPHGAVEQAVAEAFGLTDSEVPLVVVTGVRDPKKGERLVVVSARDLDLDDLRERLGDRGLPNVWIPREVRVVDRVPCLASGKLDLRALRKLAGEGESHP